MKRRFWKQQFIEKASIPDMTVRDFCRLKNVTEKSYWYFHKKLADELEDDLFKHNSSLSSLCAVKESGNNSVINDL